MTRLIGLQNPRHGEERPLGRVSNHARPTGQHRPRAAARRPRAHPPRPESRSGRRASAADRGRRSGASRTGGTQPRSAVRRSDTFARSSRGHLERLPWPGGVDGQFEPCAEAAPQGH